MLAPGTTRDENYGSISAGGRGERSVWIAIVVIVAVFGILMLLLVPRSEDGDDGPLPRDVETRLLLGESPEEIDREANASPDHPDAP